MNWTKTRGGKKMRRYDRDRLYDIYCRITRLQATMDSLVSLMGLEEGDLIEKNPFGSDGTDGCGGSMPDLYSPTVKMDGLDKRIIEVVERAIKNKRIRI